jgi:NAD(P)-dependent dehydrogenase (short-subunit alcohol dehydrogenase family)
MTQQGGGVIVNIASTSGFRGAQAGAAYTASKHAIVGLTKNIAATFRGEGIRCNGVCPGATGFGAKGGAAPGDEVDPRGFKRLYGEDMQLPPMGTPAGIASIVLFLTHEDSARINGALIVADDGLSAL